MKKLGLLMLIMMIGITLGCKKTENDNRIKVVSTIGMIHDLVINIGGDKVSAEGMMGPGVDPHLYKPNAGDVASLSKANIIFYNGLHLEAKMGEVLEKMEGEKRIVAVTEKIDESKLLGSQDYEGLHDPHVWFDVTLWIQAAETIRDTFVSYDPDNAEIYENNASKYISELTLLEQSVRKYIAQLPQEKRILVTAHDAFNYFAKAYSFQVRGLQGISTAAEAGTKDVQELATFIAEKKIPAIFVESAVPERHIKAVQEAVKAKGWNVTIGGELFADAMGDEGTEEGTYQGMVKHNVTTIVNALKGK